MKIKAERSSFRPYPVTKLRVIFNDRDERVAILPALEEILNYSTKNSTNPLNRYGTVELTTPPSPYIVGKLISTFAAEFADEDTKNWYREAQAVRVKAKKYANDTHVTPETEHLRPLQRAGARFGYAMKRILCADDTGTGKTYTSLAIADQLMKQSPNYHVIVFTLKNVVPQWLDFAATLLKTPCEIHDLSNPKNRRDRFAEIARLPGRHVIVANWEVLNFHRDELVRSKWDFVIGDEAHVLCNRKAQKTRNLNDVFRTSDPRAIFLTGTPIEKGPGDMWSLLHLLDPTLFSSYWAFFNYFTKVEADPYTQTVKVVGARNRAILRDILSPYYIRRSLAEMSAEVTAPTLGKAHCVLTPEHRRIYNMIEKGLIDKHSELTRDDTTSIGQFVGARQAAIHTQLVSLVDTPSVKIERLIETIYGADPEAYHVVFSSFRLGVDLIVASLEKAGLKCSKFYGGEDPKIHRDFVKGQSTRVLVATPESLGTGIDGLQIARYMHFVDIPWSHRIWRQTIARIVRIGAEGDAYVLHYVAKDTVDSDVWDLISGKATTFDEVVVSRRIIDRLKPIEKK